MAQPLTVRLSVEKMSCASCVGRVDRAFADVPGVMDVSVNLATETATVTLANQNVAPDALVAAATSAGYPAKILSERKRPDIQARRAEEASQLGRQTLLATALGLPVFILEMGGHLVPGFHALIGQTIGHTASWTIQGVLATLVLAGPGRSFYRIGFPALAKAQPDMNSLVAVGTAAAYLFSLAVLVVPSLVPEQSRAVYFEAAVVIVVLILLGRWLEARAKGRTGAAIQALIGLQPKTARVLRDGTERDVDISDITVGDDIILRPGERVPVDGMITQGAGYLDESMITGEPLAVAKDNGDTVIAGTINGASSLTLQATQVGEDTVLANIIRLVEDAQGAKLPIQGVVNRITLWFVPAIFLVAAVTISVWLFVGPTPAISYALVAGVSVLIIACPCAMGLATPTSIMVATGRAAGLGVLFRRGDALQTLSDIDVVVFDKTGTLTEGRPVLASFDVTQTFDRRRALSLIAAVESRAEHPIAHAILAAAQSEGIEIPSVQKVSAHVGQGVSGFADGHIVLIGTARMMEAHNVDLSHTETTSHDSSETRFYAAIDGVLAAMLGVTDGIKSNAKDVVATLIEKGKTVVMVSGDQQVTADAIATQIGITQVHAGVSPKGKSTVLQKLQGEGAKIAFVGDGINDAPALATADVGIAIGTGTDVAIETADIVLMSGDLRGVLSAIDVSRATMRNIRQNLFWAFGYNIALVPVAAGVLYPAFGILLSPMLAAGAMGLSSLFVLSNAMRLRRLKGAML